MLELAVKARIPLIYVQTDDVIHSRAMLMACLGVNVALYAATGVKAAKGSGVFFIPDGHAMKEADLKAMYTDAAKAGRSIIFVNGPKNQAMYDAGILVCPESLIHDYVSKRFPSKAVNVSSHVQTLRGLTYKAVKDVCALAMTKFHELTPNGLRAMRRKYHGTIRGLHEIPTTLGYYQPPKFLTEWVDDEGPMFLGHTGLLQPRGLLLAGAPGTGKTMGAKYIAHSLDVPLYALNLGAVLGKYVGESESRLTESLQQAELCAPCVLLVDEVEKLFTGSDDSGVMNRILAQLLWWLEEKQDKVLVVMTTNDESVLPPELIRPGRIDQTMVFPYLDTEEANGLRYSILHSMIGDGAAKYHKSYGEIEGLTPSRVARDTINQVKQLLRTGVIKL